MEDAELRGKLDELEKKIDAIYISSEKTRKYFLTFLIVSGLGFLIPLVGLLFAIPSFISTYSQLGGL